MTIKPTHNTQVEEGGGTERKVEEGVFFS
jgi:hypothetical protein